MNTATLYVIYQGNPHDHFDRSYYAEKHLPLVNASFARYGLLNLSVFYPEVSQPGTLAICECIFRDEEAMNTAFNSPEAAAVIQDVAEFTHLTPIRLRGIPC